MPSRPINTDIRLKFASCGYRISIKTLDNKKGTLILGIVEAPDRGSQKRFCMLLLFYFKRFDPLEDNYFVVQSDHFLSDGHGQTGICKKCGCTEEDAWSDPDIGELFVEDDLCCWCMTPEEKVALIHAINQETETAIRESMEGGDYAEG